MTGYIQIQLKGSHDDVVEAMRTIAHFARTNARTRWVFDGELRETTGANETKEGR